MLLFFQIIPANAQNTIIDHLSTNDGLSSGNVMSIIQDSRGYMWFGTEDGLNKFDGYEFTVYRHNPTDSTSISDNWVNSIVEDNNELWIGTSDGLSRYSYQNDNFKQYFHDSRDSNSFRNNHINSIVKDRKGQIWVGTASELNLYDRMRDNFVAYSCIPGIDKQNGNNLVNRITLGANDNIFLCTISGLFQFDPSKKQFTKYLKDAAVDDHFNLSSIAYAFVDTKNNVWIGTESEGLYYLDKALQKLYHFKHNPNDSRSLCYDGISHIMEDNKGNIWISTITGLSYVRHGTNIRQAKGIFNNLRQDSKNANGLSLNIINVTFQDKNDRLWIGGRFGDINIMDNQSNQFKNFKFTDIDSRFTSNNMTAMAEDKEGNIWFGADGGGIYFWNREEDEYKVIRPNFENNASLILTMCLDSYDNLWIGMWQMGIDKLDLKNNTYTHYRYNPADAHSVASDNVFFIKEDSKKNIWIGGNFWGLNLYDPVHERFNLVPYGFRDSATIAANSVVYIYEDRAKDFWIGSRSNGLNYMDSGEKTFKKYLNNKLDSSSISNNAITCIYEDSHKRLWIGTRGGLNLFNRENHTFQRFTVLDGLPNDIICRILEDGKGNLWLSTVNGLCRVSATENKNRGFVFKNFDHSDGLLNNQFNLWSALKTNRGELIFGSVYGVSIFNPDSIRENRVIPTIAVTDFSIFNKPVRIGEPGSPLTKHIAETKIITLSHKQSVISFEFAALNFINTEKNEYAYWLEGFENDWKYVGNERKATYTNLDPGKYIFRVKGSNNDGYWNEEGTSIELIIPPPWWKTLIFRIFFTIFVLGIVWGFYYYRINLLKEQKKILEDLVKKRTKEVEEKNAVLMNQAEELHESNAVLEERQQFIEEQAEELKMKNEYLQEANEQSLAKQEMIIMQAEDLEVTNRKLTVINATKDKLFSIIAHDLKNPFSSILSFSEILLTKFQDLAEEKKLKFINAIFDSSKRVYDLLENLLQWARTQTGNIEYKPEAFYLCEVIDTNYDLVKDMLVEKEITFTKNATDSMMVFADRNMINAVIRNLLGNALKYTEKGSISVSITRNGDFAEVNVVDTGTGISEAKMTTIFEIEQQKSTSGTRGEKGSGLGLIICREFVQLNGGEISVRSSQGKGTTFVFTLPLNKD